MTQLQHEDYAGPMLTVAILNIYWFGAAPSAIVHFNRSAEDDVTLSELIKTVDADVFAFIEIVDIERLERVLAQVDATWTVRDSEGAVVANLPPSNTSTQKVVFAWRRNRVGLVQWTPLNGGHPRKPVAARFRDLATQAEWTAVAVHPKSGNPLLAVPDADAEQRRVLFEAVAGWLQAPPLGFDGPLAMVLGDYNSVRGSFEVAPLTEGGMDGWRILEPSLRPAGAELRTTKTDPAVIDHFALSPTLASMVESGPEIYAFDADPAFVGTTLESDAVWKRVTDHRPVRLSLNLPVGDLVNPNAPPGPGGLGPARLTLLERHALNIKGIKDISAIAPIGDGFALLVHDDRGIYLRSPDGTNRLLSAPAASPKLQKRVDKAFKDLESVCVSEESALAMGGVAAGMADPVLLRRGYTLTEVTGELFGFEIWRANGSVSLESIELLGVLRRPGDAEKHGWEGMAFLSAAQAKDGQEGLFVVNEKSPVALAFFTLPGLAPKGLVMLDEVVDGPFSDVSDVAVCPLTGNLFLLSDESCRIVEATWDPATQELRQIGASDLEPFLGDRAKAEGIAFESADRLVVVTDGTGELLRFRVER